GAAALRSRSRARGPARHPGRGHHRQRDDAQPPRAAAEGAGAGKPGAMRAPAQTDCAGPGPGTPLGRVRCPARVPGGLRLGPRGRFQAPALHREPVRPKESVKEYGMPERDGSRGNRGAGWSRFSRTASFWLLVILIPVLIIQVLSPRKQESIELNYSQFVAQLDAGNVTKVTITEGQRIEGTLETPVMAEGHAVRNFRTLLPIRDSE